jgi:hypothetical protein|nr:MAG TPA: hypothetical protein [Caudoviricetes sp.]
MFYNPMCSIKEPEMELDVNTLHQEFKNLLNERGVFLINGTVRGIVNLNLGLVTRDTSQEIIDWWLNGAEAFVDTRSTKGNLEKEEVTDTIKLKDGEVVYRFSRRTNLVLRFVDRSGETVETNEYSLSICI